MKLKPGIFVRNNKATILTCVSLVGVVTTCIFTARGTMEADRILDEVDKENNRLPDVVDEDGEERTFTPLSFKEKADLVWKCYIPAGISGVLTIAAIIGSSYISNKEIAALTGTVAVLVANRDQLEEAIREKYGEDVLAELKKKIAVRHPEKEYVEIYAEETGKGRLLCFEGYSGRWFRSEEDEVNRTLSEFSQRYKDGECLCINDLHTMLGIESTHFGWQYGWPTAECCGYDQEEGIPMYTTRIFDDKLKEDVLYIDLGYEDEAWKHPVYPIENWYEY